VRERAAEPADEPHRLGRHRLLSFPVPPTPFRESFGTLVDAAPGSSSWSMAHEQVAVELYSFKKKFWAFPAGAELKPAGDVSELP
jgi:hypothetical protein